MRPSHFLLAALLAACGHPLPDEVDQASHRLTFEAVEIIEPLDVASPDPGGLPPPPLGVGAPQFGPWASQPVVYHQHVTAATSGVYSAMWSNARDLHYHPAGLNAEFEGGATRYNGVWKKDERIVDWASARYRTEAEYLAAQTDRDAEGFRVLDLDAHSVNGALRYHAIWVRDLVPTAYKVHHRLSQASLSANIASYEALGYRPTRINGYHDGRGVRFTAVWIRDGRTDFHAHQGLSKNELINLRGQYAGQGYVLVDIAPYKVLGIRKFAAIWLANDGSVDAADSTFDMTVSAFEETNETRIKNNMVLMDLDSYVDGIGLRRVTAIWHRPFARQLIESNLPINGNVNLTFMASTLAEYTTPGNDGRAGTMGVFIQDLQTGDYVAVNPHEPHYMASTSKVLIGARAAAHPQIDVANGWYWFDTTAWRGENTRGFQLNDVNTLMTLQTLMTNMLINSDTASTDALHGLITANDGPDGLTDWLRDVVQLQNVGEVTSICDVDRRISAAEDACVLNVSCDTFETWFRGAGGPWWNATQAEQDCLNGLVNDRSLENHEDYYSTLANTITPAEYGRFWQKLADGDLMDNADRAVFLATIDPSGDSGFNNLGGVVYDEFGTKNGGKRRVSSQVGMMWDWNNGAGDYTDITPRYAFALVTEDWDWETNADLDNNNVSDDTDWARAAMRSVLQNGINFLRNP